MKRNYDDPVYREWRLRVLKRDKFKCQMPLCNAKKNLQVHHIQKWSSASMLRYEVSNGICLCRKCHQEVTRNEVYYQGLFMDIVRKKK